MKITSVTPILPVSDLDRSVAFYEAAGFEVRVYEGGGFAFVTFEDDSVVDLALGEEMPAGTANRPGCFIVVPHADAWHERLSAAGLPVTDLEDMPWGMRELTVTDPDGNYLRIGHSI